MNTFISNWDWKILYVFYNPLAGNPTWYPVLHWLAVLLIYLFPIFLVYLWFFKKEKILALRAFLAGIVGWLVFCKVIQFFFFRARPFATSNSVKELVFHRPDTSFPSDHAAFTLAIALVILWSNNKKWGWALLGLSLVISLARIAAGLHFPTDILVGWFLGLGSALLFHYLANFWEVYIIRPIVKVAERLRL